MAMKANIRRYEVVVVGAGIAGYAIAKALADQGRQVLIIERQLSEPDRIVGELLQPGGVLALSKLGLDDCVKDIDAIPITGYHIFWKGEQEASFEFCPLPGETEANARIGQSFHHGRFVGKLRQRLLREERIDLMEGNAVEIIRDDESGKTVGVVCRDGKSTKASSPNFLLERFTAPNRHQYHGNLIIVADGATSNFRSQVSASRPTSRSKFWGLELMDVDLPFHNYAHGILGSGPPVLIYQISKRKTRMLIDISDEMYQSLGDKSQDMRSHILATLLPVLPTKLQSSFRDAVRGGRLRSIPNRCMPSFRIQMPGLVVLGDALNMRHPLTGGGMTVALKDAILLADLLAPVHVPLLSDHNLVLRRMNTFHWQRKRYAASINILAQALYLLFATKDNGLELMQKGFVRYIQKGEQNFAEPVGIMGGYIESPLRLLYHFVYIALYSICLHIYEAGPVLFPVAILQSWVVLLGAVKIILPSVLDELRG